MSSHRVTDSDIVDVFLGDGDPKKKERVYEAMRSDSSIACAADQWARVLEAVQEEKVSADLIMRRVRDRVLIGLRQGRHLTLTYRYARTFSYKTAAALAAATCLVVVIIWGIQGQTTNFRHNGTALWEQKRGNSWSVPEFSESTVTYVALCKIKVEGTDASVLPYPTLVAGLAAASPGGTIRILADSSGSSTPETPRIDKPVRIEAVSGSVRIGG